MIMHWASQYLGQPWIQHENDCWAFFRRVSENHFNRHLSIIELDTSNVKTCVDNLLNHPELHSWLKTEQPKEGDAVLMSKSKAPTHVGMWLDVDGGGILHCVKGAGVIFTKFTLLHLIGFNVTGFYSYKESAIC